MTTLFVYCNLVTPHCVGGENVRLLKLVTIPHGANQINVRREFNHTHYLYVESGSHGGVIIDIYCGKRDRVLFEGGKVVVTHPTFEKPNPFANHVAFKVVRHPFFLQTILYSAVG